MILSLRTYIIAAAALVLGCFVTAIFPTWPVPQIALGSVAIGALAYLPRWVRETLRDSMEPEGYREHP